MELVGSWSVNAGTSIAATSTTGQLVALAHRGLCVSRACSSIGQLMATMLGGRSAPGLGQQNLLPELETYAAQDLL